MASLSRRRHAPKGPLTTATAEYPMGTDHPMGRPQCTAHSKQTGERCKQRPIPGGRVCHYHGGAVPQVKEAAKERLRALQYPAIDRIAKLIDQEQFPSVSYAASKDVLDRTLGRATEVVEMQHSGSIEVMQIERLQRGRKRNAER